MICNIEISAAYIVTTAFSSVTALMVAVIWYVIRQFVENQKESNIAIKNELKTLSAQIAKNDSDTYHISENYKKMMEIVQRRLDLHTDNSTELAKQFIHVSAKNESLKQEIDEMKMNCRMNHNKSGL